MMERVMAGRTFPDDHPGIAVCIYEGGDYA